ncbi:MAG: Cys-Xaa-Xaa-Xaa repeat radical SAM target protein [Porphyromonadaceae bacterium]|nr:Cys-Xaa-Xaa-Xaa repeat radical SAM target protein [Porphyromonadaceae bacterium]
MKQNKNEELQSRRQFFKKAAKATLPILGAIVATNLPFVSHAATNHESETENSCSWGCSGGCSGSCGRVCSYGCSNSCAGSCSGACKGYCQGSCKGSCAYGCSGYSY